MSASVSGLTITDKDNNPLEGVQVVGYSNGKVTFTELTDNQGKITIGQSTLDASTTPDPHLEAPLETIDVNKNVDPQGFVSLATAKGLRTKINTQGTIKSIGERRVVNLKAGGTNDVCDVILEDGTGGIKLTLWGDEINVVAVGDKLKIINGYTTMFKGEVALAKGKFGQLQKI